MTFSQVSDVQTKMLWAISLAGGNCHVSSGLQNDSLLHPLSSWFLAVVSDSALLSFTPLEAARCPGNSIDNSFSFSFTALIYIYPISMGFFNHPFPLVHPFVPTTPACLKKFHDPAIFFASPVWGTSIEGRVCRSGETCLDVKTLAHNTAKSLRLIFFPWLCCRVLSDTLHVLIRSVGHLLPLPTTASIARSSSPSTFELCSSKISHACLRLQLKHLRVPSKGIIPLALMLLLQGAGCFNNVPSSWHLYSWDVNQV